MAVEHRGQAAINLLSQLLLGLSMATENNRDFRLEYLDEDFAKFRLQSD